MGGRSQAGGRGAHPTMRMVRLRSKAGGGGARPTVGMAGHAHGLEAVMLGIAATVLFATIFLAAPAEPFPQSAEAASQLVAGDAALARLDLRAAVAAFRAAVGVAPASYEAAWKLARALADSATLSQDRQEQEKLCTEAEGFARKAVLLDPAGAQGHDCLAIALGKLALFEGGKRKVELSKEVKAEAEKALERDPNDDLALHVLAIWNRELVQLNWFLRQAAQVLYGRLPQASLDAAIADLKRASELRPDVIPHHVEFGITLEAARRWPEARAELEKALALPTGWVTDDYYRGLARTHLARVRAHLE
jgi:tetratricopeptide (TPR) repeat protein